MGTVSNVMSTGVNSYSRGTAEAFSIFYPSDPTARAKVDQWLFYGSATFTLRSAAVWPLDYPLSGKGAARTTALRSEPARHAWHSRQASCFKRIFRRRLFNRRRDNVSHVHLHGVKDIGLKDGSNVKCWHDAIEASPAIQRAWGPFPT